MELNEDEIKNLVNQ